MPRKLLQTHCDIKFCESSGAGIFVLPGAAIQTVSALFTRYECFVHPFVVSVRLYRPVCNAFFVPPLKTHFGKRIPYFGIYFTPL